jgi:hypothetical protein
MAAWQNITNAARNRRISVYCSPPTGAKTTLAISVLQMESEM